MVCPKARTRECYSFYKVWLSQFAIVLTPHVQAQALNPRAVIDLTSIVSQNVARSPSTVEMASENAGRWAVGVRFSNKERVILTGLIGKDEVSQLSGTFDRIAVDGQGKILLREIAPPGASWETSVVEWDPSKKDVIRLAVSAGQPELFVSAGRVFFWAASKILDQRGQTIRPTGTSLSLEWTSSDPNDAVTQSRQIVGLPGDRLAIIGSRTERISLYGFDGRLQSSSRADLSSAYASLGIDDKSHPLEFERIETGRTRITWITSSPEGYILMRLTEVPVHEPSPVAAFDPVDGRSIKVLRLNRPTSPRRRSQGNPNGYIMPDLGTYGSMLFVVDSRAGVASLY